MANDSVDRTATPQASTAMAGQDVVRANHRGTGSARPQRSELTRRVVILIFGLVQIVIGARIVLLLLDAREANALVAGILSVSDGFVAPFNGMLSTNALSSGGSMLDLAAVLALVGWTILELVVLWVVGIFRREPAYVGI